LTGDVAVVVGHSVFLLVVVVVDHVVVVSIGTDVDATPFTNIVVSHVGHVVVAVSVDNDAVAAIVCSCCI